MRVHTQVWLKRMSPAEAGHKPTADRPLATSYYIFDPSSWETIRKDNIVVLLSDLERPPNLPRPNSSANTPQREASGHLLGSSMPMAG